ncbi:MAG: hypothetical protein ACFFFT_00185 [Candidatus Thorarchaeota archaeon]
MSWQDKWIDIIKKLDQHLKTIGKEIVVINIDARVDVQEQYDMYIATVEQTKERVEVVVTTGLPGEERIFWPYGNVQFYIQEGEEKVKITGDLEAAQKILQ